MHFQQRWTKHQIQRDPDGYHRTDVKNSQIPQFGKRDGIFKDEVEDEEDGKGRK